MKKKLKFAIFLVLFFILCLVIRFWVAIQYVYDLHKIDQFYGEDIDIEYNNQDSYLSIHISDMKEYKKEIRNIMVITKNFLKKQNNLKKDIKFELRFYTSPDKILGVSYGNYMGKIQVIDVLAEQDYPKITELPELYSAQDICLMLCGSYIYTEDDMKKMKHFKNVKDIIILNARNNKRVNHLTKILKQNIPKTCKVSMCDIFGEQY